MEDSVRELVELAGRLLGGGEDLVELLVKDCGLGVGEAADLLLALARGLSTAAVNGQWVLLASCPRGGAVYVRRHGGALEVEFVEQ